VLGVELTIATFASNALAREQGDLHLSLDPGNVVDSDTDTEGGATEGGVKGGRRFTGAPVMVGILGAGNEMNIEFEFDGGCSVETAANFDELELPSDERLLLFEAMTCAVDRPYKK
jgi:hypothetical protein